MDFLFQNLRVYQKALEVADQVSSLTVGFPRASWHLRDQFNRASLSIALNSAESTGRATGADQRRFLIMARGSVHECAALLDMCERKNLLSEESHTELRGKTVVIAKMLSGMIGRVSDVGSVSEECTQYVAD